jgi:tRNA-modifying protein YgfZ
MMETSRPRSGRLTHLGVLRFTGPDALNFLQGQLTNDTKRIGANSSLLAAYLNPQGRVLALVHLLPHSSGTLAILPRELRQPIAERLRKFVLRAKVKIEDPGDSWVVSGYHGSAALTQAGLPVPGEDSGYIERNCVGVARIGRETRYWVVAPPDARLDALHAEAADTLTSPATAVIERDWRLADIQAGLPQVYAATSEVFVAQMLNLDLLDGISFSKGCYTGQEIVARTQNLGRIKRRLFHLSLPHGAWHIGDEVSLSDGRHGRLTEVIEADHGSEALAVLNLEPQPALDAESGAAKLTEATAGSSAGAVIAAVQVPLPYAPG